jgi:anti-anti-sigma factor
LTPTELGARPLTRDERVNGPSLSRVSSGHDDVILAVAGEIDISNAEELVDGVRSLVDGAEGEVVLRLQDCGFIDSIGIKALIVLARELQTRGQTLVLSGLNGEPRRVFEITGLLDGREFAIRDHAPALQEGDDER